MLSQRLLYRTDKDADIGLPSEEYVIIEDLGTP